MEVERDCLILDNGSGFLKTGWAGETFPEVIIPSIVGIPDQFQLSASNLNPEKILVGDIANEYRQWCDIVHPVEEGNIKNFDYMKEIWSYALNDKMCLWNAENCKVLLTEAAFTSQETKEKTAEIFLEEYNFEAVKFSVQAVLSLLSEGIMTGIVMDSGDGVTHVVPVINGYADKPWIDRINLAGRHITNHLIKLLLIKGYNFSTSSERETVREIKEKCCYVSCNLQLDRKLARETTAIETEYQLPDGRYIKIDRERFEAPEMLFSPWVAGLEDRGVVDLLFDVFKAMPLDNIKELLSHILISGGSSMFPGFPNRVKQDLKQKWISEKLKGEKEAIKRVKIAVWDNPKRKNAVFVGGSILGNIIKKEDHYWCTKSDWQESGASALMK